MGFAGCIGVLQAFWVRVGSTGEDIPGKKNDIHCLEKLKLVLCGQRLARGLSDMRWS